MGSKKEEELEEGSLVKLMLKLLKIVKITHHNLKLLDANLVSGCLSAFPGLNAAPKSCKSVQVLPKEGTKDKKDRKEKNV